MLEATATTEPPRDVAELRLLGLQDRPAPRGAATNEVPLPDPHATPAVVPPSTANPEPAADPRQPPRPLATVAAPLSPLLTRDRYHFSPGVPAAEIATIRDDEGEALFSYKGFASIVGIVAALVGAIVAATGIGAFAFLLYEKRPLPAAAALLLSVGFCILITYILPTISVTIYDDGDSPVITIAQQSHSPFSVTFAVAGADGRRLARFRKTLLSRLGRNRWVILDADSNARLGQAIEESVSRALIRKMLGKFARRFESNYGLLIMGRSAGVIRRRPDEHGAVDVLDLSTESTTTMDRRVTIALATLILGSEP